MSCTLINQFRNVAHRLVHGQIAQPMNVMMPNAPPASEITTSPTISSTRPLMPRNVATEIRKDQFRFACRGGRYASQNAKQQRGAGTRTSNESRCNQPPQTRLL